MLKIIAKSILWALVAILFIVIYLLVLIYSPWFQSIAVQKVASALSNPPQREIKIESLSLRFPINLEVNGLTVVENGDTTIGADYAALNVKLLPLLQMRVEATHAQIDGGAFTLGTPDSLMYLRVRRTDISADDARISLLSSRIDLAKARLSRGYVALTMLPDTSAITPPDTAQAANWQIRAGIIELADLDYSMRMMPTIDSLGVKVASATLADGLVDMTTNTIHANSLSVDGVTAAYLFPNEEDLKPYAGWVFPVDTTSTSAPWTITADHLSLTAPNALYAMHGATPQRGLDFNYLQFNDIVIKVDSFYNQATSIKVPITELRGNERCGLRLAASGVFEMDSIEMQAHQIKISTPQSDLTLDGYLGMGDFLTDPRLPLGANLSARIALYDVITAFPEYAPMINGLPQSDDIILDAIVKGTPSHLLVDKFLAMIPRHARVQLSGRIDNALNPKLISGHLDIDGDITDVAFAKSKFLDPATAKMVNIPPFNLAGNIDFSPDKIDGDLKATTAKGDLALDALWVNSAERYDVDLKLKSFPVNAFLPTLGVGTITADLSANGRGFDPFNPATDMDIKADVTSVYYQNQHFTNLRAWAQIHKEHGDLGLMSANKAADFDITGEGNLVGNRLEWSLDADIREIDLFALKLTQDTINGSGAMTANARFNKSLSDIDADVKIDEFNFLVGSERFKGSDIAAHFVSNDSTVSMKLNNQDLHADFFAPYSLNNLLTRFTTAADTLSYLIDKKIVDVNALERSIPTFRLNLDAGPNNVAADYLAQSDIYWSSLALNASKDSLIHFDGNLLGLAMGQTHLDTINADITQDGSYLYYTANLRNKPGTMDDWAKVVASGYIADDNLAILFQQQNIKGETGFLIGGMSTFNDSTITLQIAPYHPTIAYKKWTVNSDNIISYNYREQHLDADLSMFDDLSSLRIFTEHVEGSHEQEDIVIQIKDIQIADWVSINPFAPPINGGVSADMRFNWGKDDINGKGTVSVTDLTYGRNRVGTFDLDLNVTTAPGGATSADVALMIDGVKTITAKGALNDSTASNPFMLDFSMIRFPLNVINPFLPEGMAKLSGVINGQMDITGDSEHPVFNGFINFDSTEMKINMLGTTLKFSPERVPVNNNVVSFNNYAISAINDNPLRINGSIDMQDIVNPKIDLSLKAKNMQIVGSDRPRGADCYGKAFISLDALAKGNMRFLDIDATLDILAGTNVTYIMPDAQSVIASESTGDMVKFVNFNDSTQLADSIDTSAMLLNIDAVLNVNNGSTINVDLSADGKNKVSIQGQGSINYSQSFMNDTRTTGRFTINSGFARYTLPPLSEKRFDFEEGSYVAFNGNMLNPILNIHAVDKIKANVTQEGQNSRLVNFNVGLSVTNTLENMNIAFDLSTIDDITVENELQSMSPEQRANQAMNILLYGIYSSGNTKGSANIGGNMLYSFLESQLNSWAANNIRGVDLSFGIDQYNSIVNGASSTATSYSYKVSKSLFNDRVKIVVGGNYSTDDDTDENFSENLINDISFEYRLNKSGSQYIRIFRHMGFESILEGEVTQTGVGYVVKRRIRRFTDLFNFLHRKNSGSQPIQLPQQGDVIPLNPAIEPTDEKL